MLTVRARVRDGRLVVDEPTDLPEGTEVVLVTSEDEPWDLTEEQWAELKARLTSSDPTNFVPAADVFARLRAVVPTGSELTTQQAADLLNVSRQYLVRLLDTGKLHYTKTGKHRRVRIEDVLAFKEKRDVERKSVLETLTELSEDVGGYSELE